MAKKKLGEILIERGIIDQDQLNSALSHQRQWGGRLGAILVAKRFISEETLAAILGEVMRLPTVDMSKINIDPVALRMISVSICENNDLIPIAIEQTKGKSILTVAMADPLNVDILNEIEFTTDCRIRPMLATVSGIERAIRNYYRGETDINSYDTQAQKAADSEFMHLVRPGGEIEMIDTSTQAEYLFQKTHTKTPSAPSPSKAEKTSQENTAQHLSPQSTSAQVLQEFLREAQTGDLENVNKLEKYFWALMRVMAKRGLITKEEFLRELKDS
jgi:hypothetical protein